MGFDASSVVEELNYDFDSLARKLGPERHPLLVGVKGTTPEPSDDEVRQFQLDQQAAAKKFMPDGVDPTDRVALLTAMRSMPDSAFSEAQEGILDSISKLTKGEPSREQIAALPFRHQRRYITWLQKQLMDPES
jgi:hypothetical protein